MENYFDVAVKVWGPMACFTRPETPIDRTTYDIPTPSACRGVLEAIYLKPKEFWYEITEIDVLNPIRYLSVKKNEVSKKAIESKKTVLPLYMDDVRTQRTTVYLKDVAYIIKARVHIREGWAEGMNPFAKKERIRNQFERRIRKGMVFHQPFLGLRECTCYFEMPSSLDEPIKLTKDMGVCLYDVFAPYNEVPLDTRKKSFANPTVVSFYRPRMIDGRVEVPSYDSDEVIKVMEE